MNFEQWKAAVLAKHPTAEFTLETGEGETYLEEGSTCAHTGPDMQADLVGVYIPGEFCDIWGTPPRDFDPENEREMQEYPAE